jgi:voltage-gated potassium channel
VISWGLRRRLWLGVGSLTLVTAVGWIWFSVIEGFGAIDGLYQTVITVSTVGFGEVEPLDSSGRLFTVGLILVGVGALLYAAAGLAELVFEHAFHRVLHRRRERRVRHFADHVIICGFGRVGRAACDLLGQRAKLVVIDDDPERADRAEQQGLAVLVGDATSDDVLAAAGIEEARALLVCVNDDNIAVSITLSARALSPSLQILVRESMRGSEAKLHRAGADYVVNPMQMGAQQLVALAVQPAVTHFVDAIAHDPSTQVRLAEACIAPGSRLDGVTLQDAGVPEETGALVMALRDPEGTFRGRPMPGDLLQVGTTIIAMGDEDQLNQLMVIAGIKAT